MARACLASIAAVGLIVAASPAMAQTDSSASASASASATATGPMTSDQAVAEANGTTGAGVAMAPGGGADRSRQLLEYQGQEYGIGWRQWFVGIPAGIVSLFVHVEPGWSGSFVTPAMGPEFTYRNHGFEIDLAGMYIGYQSPAGIFRAATDPETSSERVESQLWGVYLTSSFLWGIRFHPMFEIQIGGAIGLGYIGGSLFRTETYRNSSAMDPNNPGTNGWGECTGFGAPDATYCNNTPGHYIGQEPGGPNMGRHVEPNWFGGGSVPAILPWISIPHVAFHFRPHRNVDVKLEVGFGLINIYGGLSAHYIF